MTMHRARAVTAAAVTTDKICNGFMESMRMLSYKIDGNLDKRKGLSQKENEAAPKKQWGCLESSDFGGL